MRRFRCAVLALALATVAALGEARAEGDAEAVAFVEKLNASVATMAGKLSADAFKACRNYVVSLVDVEALAGVAGGLAWEKMSTSQKTTYQAALEARLARECAADNKENTGAAAQFLGSRRAESGDLLVATRFTNAGPSAHTVIWRLPVEPRRRGRAIDLQVDGRSVALSFRDEADRAFDRSGGDIEAVIRSLQK